MIVFFVFGVDLMFGARLVRFLSETANRKFQVDQAIIHALHELKKASDREFDVDSSLIRGWGRFVVSGLLFFGAVMILVNLLPKIH
jgi:hypothetical protein